MKNLAIDSVFYLSIFRQKLFSLDESQHVFYFSSKARDIGK